jgi:predicted secreted protein
MAASAGKPAFGTLLKVGLATNATNATTVIGELDTIDGPSMEQGTIEITHHESPSRAREFVPGLVDGGEVNFEGNFVYADAGQAGVLGILGSGVNRLYSITFPFATAVTASFSGILTNFEIGAPVDDRLTFNGTVKVTGLPTWA